MPTTSYRIRIDQPCGEDWSAMTPRGGGRHCASCNRTLVDFSAFTDSELLAYLHAHPGACGRFASSQLNRPLLFPAAPGRATSLPKWVAGALIVAATQTAAAQQQDQLSPELPKCDDSTLAVELRMDGYVPLVVDSTTLPQSDSSSFDAASCRPCPAFPDTIRWKQDSVRLLRFVPDSTWITDRFTMGFALIEQTGPVLDISLADLSFHQPGSDSLPTRGRAPAKLPVPPAAPYPKPLPPPPLRRVPMEALIPRAAEVEEEQAELGQ